MKNRTKQSKANKTQEAENRKNLKELPYYDVNIPLVHGQFNNSLDSPYTSKKYLDNLPGLFDLDIFNLNNTTNLHIDPDHNIVNSQIRCRYFSPHSFHKEIAHFSSLDSSFSIFHNNIRSLRKNLENLQTHVLDELNLQFSLIGISETRICKTNIDGFNYQIPGYKFEYVPTPLSAGGVGMYIREDYNYYVLKKDSDEAFQALWVEIILPKSKHIICCIVYRQHNNPERFLDYIDHSLEPFIARGTPVIILGDFNIDLLKILHCNFAHNFLLSLQSCSMIPTIDKPTRLHGYSATLIDNIFVNANIDVGISGNIVTDLSDHFSQLCILNLDQTQAKINKQKIRDYSHFSPEAFNHDIELIEWNTIKNSLASDPDKLFSLFYNKLNKLLNKHVPIKQLSKRKIKQFSKPWITQGIRKSIKIKNNFFQSGDFQKYKTYRNFIVTLTRASKKSYYDHYFNSNLTNIKKTWEGINNLIGSKKSRKKSINAMRCNHTSRLFHDPIKIANILNEHFASCGSRLAAKLPHSEKHFSDYLKDNPITSSGSFACYPVEPQEIKTEILALPSNKSHGLYSCPIQILKCAKDTICFALADIFNISINNGIYPSKLKLAKIIPVFKTDDETDPNNYRPISLLSIFNKIFEKIMYKRLKSYLDMNNVISNSQYGFRENHSTEHAILDIVNQISSNIDKRLYFCGVFIDLRKAFDTVNHDILLQKLSHYGVRGIVNDWFASYLKRRCQTTEINNQISNKQLTLSGIPQGSVIGPLLFIIYINDICHSSPLLKFFLFADDTNILYANKNLRTLETIINNELCKVSEWLISNKLSLNIAKSNFVIFHPYQKKLDYEISIALYDNESQRRVSLDRKDHVKYLGVIIDSGLTWKSHIENISLKISKTVGIISRLRHFVPFNILLTLYRSLILPYLSYGVTIWGRASKSIINMLLILQKRVLRFMHFNNRQTHCIPLFLATNTLPVQMIYFENAAKLMYDVSKNAVPTSIQNLFHKTETIHNYRTRSASSGNYYIDQSRLELQKLSFARTGPLIWNCLPLTLRNESKNI